MEIMFWELAWGRAPHTCTDVGLLPPALKTQCHRPHPHPNVGHTLREWGGMVSAVYAAPRVSAITLNYAADGPFKLCRRVKSFGQQKISPAGFARRLSRS